MFLRVFSVSVILCSQVFSLPLHFAEDFEFVNSVDDDFDYDPMQSNDLFEGDILNVDPADFAGRNADINPHRKWPNGVIPYEISSAFSDDESEIIVKAMAEYHRLSCIKFVERQKENDYLFIQPGSGGCSSSIGRQGGKQELNLGSGCVFVGIAQHELMHALGFWHEQSRPDRDEYVEVNWKNIKEGKESNFMKHSSGEVDTLNLKYDVTSVLHYGPFSFAKDKSVPTIKANDDNPKMGQRDGFSLLDVEKINLLYKCPY